MDTGMLHVEGFLFCVFELRARRRKDVGKKAKSTKYGCCQLSHVGVPGSKFSHTIRCQVLFC
ncbi:hypothetical protein BaRGS_00019812, partial [Batillaria attramentaria]